MKEAYEVAEMEIIEFETEDVITTSGGGQIGGGDLVFVDLEFHYSGGGGANRRFFQMTD